MKTYIFNSVIRFAILTAVVASFAACGQKKDINSKADPRGARKTGAPKTPGLPEGLDSQAPDIKVDTDGKDEAAGQEEADQAQQTADDAQAQAGGATADRSNIPGSQAAGTDGAAASGGTAAVVGGGEGDINTELEQRQEYAKKFSGAADDAARGFFQYKLNSVEEENIRLRNIRSAQAIEKASLTMDIGTADVALRLQTKTQKGNKEIVLGGQLGADLKADLTNTNKDLVATAQAQCLDRQIAGKAQTCENIHVRLVLGENGSRSYVHILFRRTNVDLKASFPQAQCKTQDCEDLYTIFAVSQLNNGQVANVEKDLDRIKQAKLETFEVINGRSGFGLKMITNGNELIKFSGDLLNPALHNRNVVGSREVEFADQIDITTGENYKTRLNDKIKDVRITKNNGKGTITATLSTFDAQRNVGDQFELVATRKAKEIKELVEVINP